MTALRRDRGSLRGLSRVALQELGGIASCDYGDSGQERRVASGIASTLVDNLEVHC